MKLFFIIVAAILTSALLLLAGHEIYKDIRAERKAKAISERHRAEDAAWPTPKSKPTP